VFSVRSSEFGEREKCSAFRVQSFRVQGSGFREREEQFRVQGSEFRVQDKCEEREKQDGRSMPDAHEVFKTLNCYDFSFSGN
jgi:hypothetical protein